MKKLSFFLLLLVIAAVSGCSGSSGSSSDDADNVKSVKFYDGDNEIESLSFAYGTPSSFTISVTDSSGSPITNRDLEVIDEDGLLELPLFVKTGTDGKASVNVGVNAVSVNGSNGTMSFILYGDNVSLGGEAYSLPYSIEPWDLNLFGGEVDIYASAIPGTKLETIFRVPDGAVLIPSQQEIAAGITLTVSPKKVTVGYDGSFITTASAGEYDYEVGIADRDETSPLKVVVRVGDGTEENPFPIVQYGEMKNMGRDLYKTSHFRLFADIELEDIWAPVNFEGSLDGNGHSVTATGKQIFETLQNATVQNLTIKGSVNNPTSGTSGGSPYYRSAILSVYTANSTIKNITAEDASVTVSCAAGNNIHSYSGLITGLATGSTFENITLNGKIDVTNCQYSRQGMLAGSLGNSTAQFINASGDLKATYVFVPILGSIAGLSSGTITDSYGGASISVNYSDYSYYMGNIGGMVGELSTNGLMERCFSNSDALGRGQSGGLAGRISRATIKDSYATGNVHGKDSGGIAGYAASSDNSIINSYATGSISSGDFYPPGLPTAGGLLGSVDNTYSSVASTYTSTLALNAAITYDTPTGAARICKDMGIITSTTGPSNYAFREMLIGGTAAYSSDDTGINGADITPAELTPDFFITTLGWDPDVWDFDFDSRSYKLPVLKSHNVNTQTSFDMPSHLR
ncbi:hypothetical protein ADMFC3_10240 [Geovibrio sp. ADMFC3]